MAEKRRLRVSEQNQIEEENDEDLPRKFKSIGWKEWLKEDFARYWFVVIALMIDILFGLDAAKWVSGMGSLGSAIFLAISIPIEVYLYIYLWGKKGILMSHDGGRQ